ncbi:MAG: hypothetical protein KI788_06245 [Mameliella sp.]|nr:hypothetical protein [Mameliella sp.]
MLRLCAATHVNRVYIEPADLLPFHATASGVAVLAFADHALRDSVLARDCARITDATETDADVLRLLVEDARRCGFGRSEGAYEKDVHSIAAPVFDDHGSCTAAIAVALPKARLTPSSERRFMAALAEASKELSRHWGGDVPDAALKAWKCSLD